MPVQDYTVATSTGASIVPGTTDTGNHCDDCATLINLPFAAQFYDRSYTSAYVSANGFLSFTSNSIFASCIPDMYSSNIIAAHSSYLDTTNSGGGIFTSTSGSAPNRIFNIEWRAAYCCGGPPTEHFEIRLYESQNRVDLVYGANSATVPLQANKESAQQPEGFGFGIGMQRDDGSCYHTAISCGTVPANGTQYTLTPPAAVTATGAVSRKTHGAAGGFDIALPLTGTPGIECRTTGGTNDYTMIVAFSGNVTVQGSPQSQVTSGSGCVGSGGTCNGSVSVSANMVTVPLTNIANAQTISVRINGVNGLSNFDIPMSILRGDTNANGTVNAGDVAQTKGRLGQAVDATNFRSDVNANGSLNATDTAIVKQNSGTSLPPD
jgi:hypothetical protein